MKAKTIALLLTFSGLLVAGGARAETGAEVLKSKGCLNCHDAEKKKVSSAKGHPKVKASDAEVKSAVEAMLSTK